MKLNAVLGAGALALALLGSTAFTYAAEVPAGTKLADDQTFNYRVLDNINALDPGIVEDVDTSYVVGNLFEGLYNEDTKGNPVPAGAPPAWDAPPPPEASRAPPDQFSRWDGGVASTTRVAIGLAWW